MRAPFRPASLLCPALLLFLAGGCAFADHQSARMLGPGNVDLTGGASLLWATGERLDAPLAGTNHVGARAAVGLHPRVDLQVGMEWITYPEFQYGTISTYVAGVALKAGLVPDRLAFLLPVGTAFSRSEQIGPEDFWHIHPTLLFTTPLPAGWEVTPSVKAMIPIADRDRFDTFWAVNLGFGWNPEESRWTARPEAGLLIDPDRWEDGRGWHLSFGLSYLLRDRR